MDNGCFTIYSGVFTGKTSLLRLFQRKTTLPTVYINAAERPGVSGNDLLREIGIDLDKKCSSIPDDRDLVVIIDNAQCFSNDEWFWQSLLKHGPRWLPSRVRFLFATTDWFSTKGLGLIWSSCWDVSDLRLKEFEYRLLWNHTTTLATHLKRKCIEDIIWHQCSGHVGCIQQSFEAINDRFMGGSDVKDEEIIEFYLSDKVLEYMSRCFGSCHDGLDEALRAQLIHLFADSRLLSNRFPFQKRQHPALELMVAQGIVLAPDHDYSFVFSCPMAKRYFSPWLFVDRGLDAPADIKTLIRECESAHASWRPWEVSLKHHILKTLAMNTPETCRIFPELSELIPHKIPGRFAFFIGAPLRCGIEVVFGGDIDGVYHNRFAAGGEYSVLGAADSIVWNLPRRY